ncbi:protein-l-isoaspartate o-methyltransferase [Anaeramoeba flamelloides]|uniref:Protein-l-isoaspartate o-methyltransferase n=1 Tax=Anaeramoeba flamelloides TaxID=1746091 RepID=A0ABQ8XHZ8_9EUKA|nr:protein-l-isoaspartate o-methyltransferase [Anaeramoeba flamelloides]
MIKQIKTESNFHKVINSSIMTAMGVIPRRLFLSKETFKSWFEITKLSEEIAINYSYHYQKRMPGTSKSNSSSAETIGLLLSFTKIEPGSRIMKWVTTEDIRNTPNLIQLAPFDAILCGGYVKRIPNRYKALLEDRGALVTSYKKRKKHFLTAVTRKGK